MTFEDFITEFDVLKDRGYNRNTFKVANVEHASLIENLDIGLIAKILIQNVNLICLF